MNQENEHKTIEINPQLLAHTMKNAAKKRPKKNKDEDMDMEGLEDLGEERKTERRTRIRMNEQLKQGLGNRRTQRYERKSLLREYRKKQEELMKEGGEEILTFSQEGGESKLILKEPGTSLKINTSRSTGSDDFTESVEFMKHLEEEIVEKSKTEGGHTIPTKTNLPTPEYGCLKGGTMPTFRQWSGIHPYGHRTTQKIGVRYAPTTLPPVSPVAPSPIPIYQNPIPTSFQLPVTRAPILSLDGGNRDTISTHYLPPITVSPREASFVPPLLTPLEKEAQEKAREIHEKLHLQRLMKEREEEEEKKGGMEKRGKRKKTIRRKLHTGKINDRVSILIPNKTIRNRYHHFTQKIHKTSIQEIKKYLLKRGFIKVGTSAPHEILRKMYEDLHMLGGDIQNLNGENIVYNFKAEGGGNGII